MYSYHNPSYLLVTPGKSSCELQWPLLKHFTGPRKHYISWALLVGDREDKVKHSWEKNYRGAILFSFLSPIAKITGHVFSFSAFSFAVCKYLFYAYQGKLQCKSGTRFNRSRWFWRERLKSWYQWTYLQGRNKDSDTKNRLADKVGKKRVGQIERVALMYIHYHVQNI